MSTSLFLHCSTRGIFGLLNTSCQTPCLLSAIEESPCAASPNITCICANIDSLTVDMSSCITSSCSTMDQLYTKRYSEQSCGAPVRDISSRLIISQWALFALALIFVVLRFIARMPRFGGRVGWDDWTILVVLRYALHRSQPAMLFQMTSII